MDPPRSRGDVHVHGRGVQRLGRGIIGEKIATDDMHTGRDNCHEEKGRGDGGRSCKAA
jgi:hypothetical protein